MSWRRITCEERDEHIGIMGEHRRVFSSLTDISGEFGSPQIVTVWMRDDHEEPILKDVRWPNTDGSGAGPDAAPCEHYFAEDDGW